MKNMLTLIGSIMEYRRNQSLSREAFKRQQLNRFRRFVRYVQKRSPYYARVIKEHMIDVDTCRPEHFPVLTKETYMAHFDEISTNKAVTKEAVARFFQRSRDPKELFRGRFVAIHSSGTSGELSYFVYSRNEWIRGMAHNFRMVPFQLEPRRISFYGMTGGHYAGVSFVHSANRTLLSRLYRTQEVDVNLPQAEVVARLNDFQPTSIVGYPSSVCKLADRQLDGTLHIHPQSIQISGEMIGENDRRRLAQAFPSAELIEVYSCSDHMIMGIGKPQWKGIYMMEDRLMLEPLEDGLLVTNLFNRTVPLIRYRMNDMVVPIPEDEDREKLFPFMKIRQIIGRAEHSPQFRNKHGELDSISQHTIGELFVEHMKAMQVKQLNEESFVVFFTVDETAGPGAPAIVKEQLAAAWQAILHAKDMENVTFRVEQVERLDIDPRTGKYKLITD